MSRRIVLLRPDGLWAIQGLWTQPEEPPVQTGLAGVPLLRVRMTERAAYYAQEAE